MCRCGSGIHPFPDGNGRTGRALAQSILRSKGLIGSAAIPISAGLLVDVPQYFAALSAFRRGDAGPIIAEFAQASRIAASTGTRLVRRILTETTGRARGRVWLHPGIFRVLDGYAAEIQRMSSHPA